MALHGQPMPADTLIALYFDRNIEMVLSVAVMQAGGAYVRYRLASQPSAWVLCCKTPKPVAINASLNLPHVSRSPKRNRCQPALSLWNRYLPAVWR